jgi:hypothetical protein
MAVNEDQTEPIVAVEVSTPYQVRPLPHKADVNWQSDEEDTYEDAKPTEKSGVIRDRNAPAVGFHLSSPPVPCLCLSVGPDLQQG